jgi:hypothetical protein
MSENRGIDYKHWIRRKNWPFWQCCWGRALWPTTATAEPIPVFTVQLNRMAEREVESAADQATIETKLTKKVK